MKKIVLFAILVSTVAVGCAPKVARVPLTPQEDEWKSIIQSYYPAWQPQPTVAQALQSGIPVVPAEVTPALRPRSYATTGIAFEDAEDDSTMPIQEFNPVVTTPAVEDPAEPQGTAEEVAPKETATTEAPAAEITYEMYTVKKGDTLGAIAQKHYGRASRWTVIAEANADTLKGGTSLKVGQQLRIPKI